MKITNNLQQLTQDNMPGLMNMRYVYAAGQESASGSGRG